MFCRANGKLPRLSVRPATLATAKKVPWLACVALLWNISTPMDLWIFMADGSREGDLQPYGQTPKSHPHIGRMYLYVSKSAIIPEESSKSSDAMSKLLGGWCVRHRLTRIIAINIDWQTYQALPYSKRNPLLLLRLWWHSSISSSKSHTHVSKAICTCKARAFVN